MKTFFERLIRSLTAASKQEPYSTAAEIVETLAGAVSAELEPLGFEKTGARCWVRAAKTPIHEIFEYQAMRSVYCARWGFSLSFAPRLNLGPMMRNRRFQWKRTLKSAFPDLVIDPIDETGKVDEGAFRISGSVFCQAPKRPEVVATARSAVQRAMHDFGRVRSLSDFIALFEERSRMTFQRFDLESYVATHLAWGLALIALGDEDQGHVHLQKFCATFDADPNDRFIQKAIADAKAYRLQSHQPVM